MRQKAQQLATFVSDLLWPVAHTTGSHQLTSSFCPFSLMPMCLGAGEQVWKCSSALLMLVPCVHWVVVTALPRHMGGGKHSALALYPGLPLRVYLTTKEKHF